MFIIKRNGTKEKVQFDKVLERVRALADNLEVEPVIVAQKVVSGLYDGIKSSEIDTLLAETSAVMAVEHPDYSKLAGKIAISNLHKDTKGFYQTMKDLYKAGYLSPQFIKYVKTHIKEVESVIDYSRDFNFTYFGFKTLEKSYLLRVNNIIVERPQHLYMRVALAICGDKTTEDVIELYHLLSQGYYTHATPTMFNAGMHKQQMSSCYLVAMEDDSLEGIYNTLWECANISKYAGGIGLHIHNVRAKGSLIKGTNGTSNGIIPMLKVFDSTASYVDQGGGRRKGSISIYLEPWHSDIEDFLDLKKNTGKEEMRCRNLFMALWIPDLFFERVKNDEQWSLFCPHESPGMSDVYGTDFEELYVKYEQDGKARKQIKARDLMVKIIESQIETGVPYLLAKDACNQKSNQKNLGTIKSSNLCTEILEYSNHEETAVCNLASVALPKFVDVENKKYDFKELLRVTKMAAKNLNKVIDKNFYPDAKTKRSNTRHRPVGIGAQGLADVFFMLDLPYDSEGARKLNAQIFETIYFAAVEASCEEAEIDGAYETFKGSPASEGILQFDMWGVKPDMYDWDGLKKKIKKFGLRNSLLVAPMPTASTAQILDNVEAFEAQNTNLGKREVLSGEFVVVNKHLINKLQGLGIWRKELRDNIINNNGSVQGINEIPAEIQEIYKTVWEISQKVVIDMAADRGAFIDQSQSMNLYLAKPTVAQINSMIFYAHSKGLKTLCYYLRSKPPMFAQKVNTEITPAQVAAETMTAEEQLVCSIDNPEDCIACGS